MFSEPIGTPSCAAFSCVLSRERGRLFGLAYCIGQWVDSAASTTLDRSNFEPILRGELLGPLRDPVEFARVKIDPEVHTLVWPSGADFDPATLHDWPEHEGAR
jgi:hypothetical protein